MTPSPVGKLQSSLMQQESAVNNPLNRTATKVALTLVTGAVLATSSSAFADPGGWKHGRGWERHGRERVVVVPAHRAYPAYAVPAYPAQVVVERRVVVREPVYMAPPPHVYYAPPPPPAVVVRGDMNTVGGAVIGAVIGGVIGSRM